MVRQKTSLLILFGIVLLGLFLRLASIQSVPPSLSHDEVAIGYNAYSLLETGKDEYGISWPLLFRSFDDYKLPGMVYSTVPFIFVFGLNELSVRLPSALFGVTAILVLYGIAREITGDKKISIGKIKFEEAIVPTLCLSISIWHINFSRQSFESNGALTCLLFGFFFLCRSTRKPHSLLAAAFFISISIYFYYSVRVVIPFLLVVFAILYRESLLRQWKIFLVSITVGIITILPLTPWLFSSGGFSRIGMVSVANDPLFIEKKSDYTFKIATNPSIFNKIIFNRRRALVETFLHNYTVNLSPRHLFQTGTGPLGLMYFWEIPFFYIGFVTLLLSPYKIKWLFLTWILTAPLAGGLTINQPNSLRTLLNAPFFSLLSGLGFLSFFKIFISDKQRMIASIATFSVISIFLTQFITVYFSVYPKTNSRAFGDGHKQLVSSLSGIESQYDQIYITGSYWRPYIFYLFWKKYDPNQYQQYGTKDKIDNVTFGRASWDQEGIYFGDKNLNLESLSPGFKKTVYVLTPEEFALHEEVLQQVTTVDGLWSKSVFVIATLKKHE